MEHNSTLRRIRGFHGIPASRPGSVLTEFATACDPGSGGPRSEPPVKLKIPSVTKTLSRIKSPTYTSEVRRLVRGGTGTSYDVTLSRIQSPTYTSQVRQLRLGQETTVALSRIQSPTYTSEVRKLVVETAGQHFSTLRKITSRLSKVRAFNNSGDCWSHTVHTTNPDVQTYAIGFGYLEPEHLTVTLAGATVAYTLDGVGSVVLDAAPDPGKSLEIRRTTPSTTLLVDFSAGASLRAADLQRAYYQVRYVLEEIFDRAHFC